MTLRARPLGNIELGHPSQEFTQKGFKIVPLGAPLFLRLLFNYFQDYPFIDFELRSPQAVSRSRALPVSAFIRT
jgi:hypothetical protein